MKLLLAGETGPGSLLSSMRPALELATTLTVHDPSGFGAGLIDRRGPVARVRRAANLRRVPARLAAEVTRSSPDVLLVVKGRGLSAADVCALRRRGTTVVVLYPDNPFWRALDAPDAVERLCAADLAIVWSERIAHRLRARGATVAVVPFGYDHRWFPVTDPAAARHGVAFLGTWSPRRARFLAALEGIPTVVRGSGWGSAAGPATFEARAGALLARAAVGVNLLHPQCAGAHNMRTREIAASGATQVTDAGVDGTPLRDGEDCRWFSSPLDLRRQVEWCLARREESVGLAARAQTRVVADTYDSRAAQVLAAIEHVAGAR